jgi:calcineurin-like phosphoesterase family protein
MPDLFFTADTHFGHWTSPERNVIKYCNRPFASIEDMDSTLIKKWNDKVGKKDTIYVIGDFALCKKELFPYYMTNLNGNKIFIHGDHDRLFSDNLPYLINATIREQPITLCHWCMRVWSRSHYNAWMLYGHSHGKLKNRPDNFNLVKGR